MDLDARPTGIPGCLELRPREISDHRGAFIKTFRGDRFRALRLPTDWAEQYYSESKPGVLRGLHLQLPPFDHGKLVHCMRGHVVDVVVDLRKGSPAEGQAARVELSAETRNMLYVPNGLAHGFCTTDVPATVLYCATTVHAPDFEAGIRWDSLEVAWPLSAPTLSARDARLPPLSAFESPFVFDPDAQAVATP